MTSKCKGCGKLIRWEQTPDYKNIPLDVSAPVYALIEQQGKPTVVVRTHLCFVSHFSTCPKASDFSKGGKQNG